MSYINVGLLGLGIVGTGVAQELLKYGDRHRLHLKAVAVKDPTKLREIKVPELTDDPYEVTRRSDIQLVVELMGGEQPAYDCIMKAIRKGKSVVTANKTVLAKYGKRIFDVARESKVGVGYEGSVGGGIQIIHLFHYLRPADRIHTLMGIVNGTTNYMLTRKYDWILKSMQERVDLNIALKEAQRLGYAEADPTKDISGEDARDKLAILAMLLYNTSIKPESIYCEGLSDIPNEELRRAYELGYRLKFLAIAKYHDGTLELRVQPTLLENSHKLVSIDGVSNAIYWEGELCGAQMYEGKGAGRPATTSAVMSDIIRIADNIRSGKTDKLPTLDSSVKILSKGYMKVGGYLRIDLKDAPGTLEEISGITHRGDINIEQVLQRKEDRFKLDDVPYAHVTITTDPTEYRRFTRVLGRLTSSTNVLGNPFFLPIETQLLKG